MKAAIIGYGSIGSRHYRILKELGLSVAVVSRRALEAVDQCFPNIEECLSSWGPDYVVIANETALHFDSLTKLQTRGFAGKLLIEKPVFAKLPPSLKMPRQTWVAYNLRFSPIIQQLKSRLEGQTIYASVVFCGQYLPQWRPNRSIQESYSGKKDMGGGVLRDLSHELDYSSWLFGVPKQFTALVEKKSSMDIESDDTSSLLMTTEKGAHVLIHINYIAAVPTRKILITTEAHQYEADLIQKTLMTDGQIEPLPYEADLTYREMHKAVLNDKTEISHHLCTFAEALQTLKLIEGAEDASERKIWSTL